MVESLGYPGKYMLHLYGCHRLIENERSENLFKNIWYHVMKDRSLQSCDVSQKSVLNLINDDYAIRKVIITPTRRIFTPPTPTSFRHIFRIADYKKIIEVSFENDESDGYNDYHLSQLAESVCVEGIKICGERYYELGCSNSKFRESGSFFYRGTKRQILCILKSLGEFEEALPAKIAARIGMNFTSVFEGINFERYQLYPDILSADGKYNFTDGCGQMSLNLAWKLQKHFKLKRLPSAVQFRFPGFKGVLLFDDKFQTIPIIFRQSQKKFDAPFNDKSFLDIIKVSKPAECKLNKNLIEILCQNAAKYDDTITRRVEGRLTKLYNNSVQSILDKALNSTKFVETLKKLPKYMDYSQMKSYTPEIFQSEPFLRQMVQADAVMKFEIMAEKQHINLPNCFGRTAIGAADFHGYLKPGEVFFQYSKNVDARCQETILHVGPIAITRSPMYSLGDIRFVKAVDCPALHHIVDVLIFPTCGSRPIQDEISGGDLDGDEYVVFWDPDLMLPHSYPAAEFIHPKPSEFEKIGIDQVQEKFPEFRKQYMQNNNVGAASNNLAILGELFGYDNDNMKELALKVDIALLYFKSGIPGPTLKNHEESNFDPDHVMKINKPMYSLNNLIGNFYRRSKDIIEGIADVRESDQSVPVLDPLIYFPGWEKWERIAESKFETFKSQVDVLLFQHNLQTTGELFSNKFSRQDYNVENEFSTSSPRFVQRMVFDLMKNFRGRILDEFVSNWKNMQVFQEAEFFDFYLPQIPCDLKKFAVACYKVAYENKKYLAFPWILWDVLDDIRRLNKNRDFVPEVSLSSFLFGFVQGLANFFEIATALTDMIKDFQQNYDVEISGTTLSDLVNKFLYTKRADINDSSSTFQTFIIFCRYIGIEEYENLMHSALLTQFAKTCRLLLLKVSFELNFTTFGTQFTRNSTTNSLKIATFFLEVDLSSDLRNLLQRRLLQKTNCEKIIVDLLKDRQSSKIYQIFALGTRDALTNLRNIVTIEMDEENVLDLETNHHLNIQLSTTKIRRIL